MTGRFGVESQPADAGSWRSIAAMTASRRQRAAARAAGTPARATTSVGRNRPASASISGAASRQLSGTKIAPHRSAPSAITSRSMPLRPRNATRCPPVAEPVGEPRRRRDRRAPTARHSSAAGRSPARRRRSCLDRRPRSATDRGEFCGQPLLRDCRALYLYVTHTIVEMEDASMAPRRGREPALGRLDGLLGFHLRMASAAMARDFARRWPISA